MLCEQKKAPTLWVRAEEKLGDVLLSHTLVCSTIGDEGLDF